MKTIIALFVTLMAIAMTVEARATYPAHVVPVYRFVRALPDLDASRVQRQAGGGGHHDVVDFGAHTGHHGAFGWYADFPVHSSGN